MYCMTLNAMSSEIKDLRKFFFAISHTFSRDTTNSYLPVVPIPISTHPTV
jgi:hypothetical protein